ncbi:MAG: hypothetical protein A2081_01180 [Elusimicrobia bacterium GWC2_61_19]|nr:MAG: hypothetical protein A2081_01180 [Elusimicrobia bacterium GWC2_61_19]HBB67410.1 hypothetical protein [Elusimicrobiota bacterium]
MEKKLLVIDDNDEYRGLMLQYFSGKGYIVDAVCSGRQGVEKALLGRPDIIILDAMMPRFSGVEVLRELQVDELTSSIPVLLVSGHAFDDGIKTLFCLEPNCADFLPKSADLAPLHRKIEECLSKW